RVLAHGQFILGPEVEELEARLAALSGVPAAVTCSSGTDALLLALMAWEVGPGDAVFVPAFTFAATAEVAALVGATPVFADVSPDTFNLDPDSLVAAVEVATAAGLRPAAVIPVDLFGQPADYPAIGKVAAEVGVPVLADGAQSFGASLGGRRVGSLAAATTLSFFPSKPLGAYGDGGAVLTADQGLADRLRSLRAHGKGADRYDHVRIGINARLDTLQAAVLLAKLDVFEAEIAARAEVAQRYSQLLDGEVGVPRVAETATSVWAQYTVVVEGRKAVIAHLGGRGIATAVHYPIPLHRQPAFAGCPTAAPDLEVSQWLAERVLSLPMHPYLAPEEQDRVVAALREAQA
ncbi:MAG: DegT/DnrJ/EryC1/StrS family aminotransferase, partial [Acidimicrobiia bacterium]